MMTGLSKFVTLDWLGIKKSFRKITMARLELHIGWLLKFLEVKNMKKLLIFTLSV